MLSSLSEYLIAFALKQGTYLWPELPPPIEAVDFSLSRAGFIVTGKACPRDLYCSVLLEEVTNALQEALPEARDRIARDISQYDTRAERVFLTDALIEIELEDGTIAIEAPVLEVGTDVAYSGLSRWYDLLAEVSVPRAALLTYDSLVIGRLTALAATRVIVDAEIIVNVEEGCSRIAYKLQIPLSEIWGWSPCDSLGYYTNG